MFVFLFPPHILLNGFRNGKTKTGTKYTCQLFLRCRREIFILCWAVFENDTIISEDSRRSPKSSEDV